MDHPVGAHWLLVGAVLGGMSALLLSRMSPNDLWNLLYVVLALAYLLVSPFAFTAAVRKIKESRKPVRGRRNRVR